KWLALTGLGRGRGRSCDQRVRGDHDSALGGGGYRRAGVLRLEYHAICGGLDSGLGPVATSSGKTGSASQLLDVLAVLCHWHDPVRGSAFHAFPALCPHDSRFGWWLAAGPELFFDPAGI